MREGVFVENNDIKLKGTKDGVDIYLDSRLESSELFRTYKEFLEGKADFFKGSRVNIVKLVGNYFSEEQKDELEKITRAGVDCIKVDFMTMEDFRSHPFVRKEKEEPVRRRRRRNEPEVPQKASHKEVDIPTRYVEGTIRSGDTVEYDGNVVIIGDVNAGAQIKAGGSVFVMGTLRGTAHAGCNGDVNAYIYALCMVPLQIRIAHIIAKSPDSKPKLQLKPEIARITGEFISVESAVDR